MTPDLRMRQIQPLRTGKVLALLAVLLPTLFGILGLVVDGGVLMYEYRSLQQATDSAATAAALEISRDESVEFAAARATEIVQDHNGLDDAEVDVQIPPSTGPHAGDTNYAEVTVTRQASTYFMRVVRNESAVTVTTRAVAGSEDATAGAAVVVLDPDPPGIAVTGLPVEISPLPPARLGGLEVLGLGQLQVQAAVLVNTEWGGVDEDGNPAGDSSGPPYAATCTPLLALTKLLAPDIYVVGGVDDPANYGHIDPDEPSALQANRRPVPDPLLDLPVPTVSVDSTNVLTDERGAVSITNLNLLGPPPTLQPGVYESIEVLLGPVVFEPGVYVIRNVNPLTGIALNLVGGPVTADGVMFYVTDNASYSPGSGEPDASDGSTVPSAPGITTLTPSVVINAAVLGSAYAPLDDPSSPFDGLLIFQRRTDRRPIVIEAEQLLSSGNVAGSVYSKWGEVVFVGNGTYDFRVAAGSVRFVNALALELDPSRLFPPVREVFLVE